MKKYLQVLLIAVCVLLGAAFFVYTVARPRLLLFRSLYVERPVTATGVITGFDTRASVTDGIKVQSRVPVVEFVTEDGVKRKFTSEITARPDMKKGDKTEVLFNAKKAVIKQEYLSMRNALIVRVVLAGCMLFSVTRKRRNRRRNAEIPTRNIYGDHDANNKRRKRTAVL